MAWDTGFGSRAELVDSWRGYKQAAERLQAEEAAGRFSDHVMPDGKTETAEHYWGRVRTLEERGREYGWGEWPGMVTPPPGSPDPAGSRAVEAVQLISNDWAVLFALYDADEPLTHGMQGGLERAANLEKSSVGRALGRLKKLGLVTPAAGARGFSLTELGRARVREKRGQAAPP